MKGENKIFELFITQKDLAAIQVKKHSKIPIEIHLKFFLTVSAVLIANHRKYNN